jgi:hypothetical protein
MTHLHPVSLHLLRGLFASLLGALLGAVGAISLAFGYTVWKWWVSGANELELNYDLWYFKKDLVFPVIGCAAVFACTGWATSAPAGNYSVVPTLVVIVLSSILGWYVLGGMDLTPRRFKSTYHPLVYLSELVILLGPPVVTAAVLTVMRVRHGVKSAS